VQLAQAAPKRLDLMLVGTLLPLSEFDGFQDFLHVLESGTEGLNDVVNLFDGLGNGRGSRPGVAAGWPRDFWRDGSCGLDRFSRLRDILRDRGRRLSGSFVRAPSPAPAAATPASPAPAAVRGC